MFFFLAENTAIFMCKCCNLFSPNQSELLTHVSEKHSEEGVNADDVIIPLRPLNTPETPNPSKGGDGKDSRRAGQGPLIQEHSRLLWDQLSGSWCSRNLENPTGAASFSECSSCERSDL